MRNAETVLGVIRDRGKRELLLEDVYRQLYNRDLYLRAYNRLYRNDGAMTPGATKETVDAMSLEKIDNIIKVLRNEHYRWIPVKRIYIPKKSGKLRPLGLPSWSDKLLQEVMRSILEAYYEPQFSLYSHGFRQGRGCHTALGEITKSWRGVKWFIEGDISQCFDSFDHGILLSILSEKIKDKRFIRLVSNLLKAGYLEDWKFNNTLSGVPQGGVLSPILSNIYLHRLDKFVTTELFPVYNKGVKRKPYQPYMKLLNEAWKERNKGNKKEAKRLRSKAQKMPSRDPNDPKFRRFKYLRYADDWLIGFSGSHREAEKIKEQITDFMHKNLKLKLSEEKTLITNARSEAAKFLGYEIVTLDADDKQHQELHRRSINGAPGLKVPVKVIKTKCSKYMKRGKPIQLAARIQDTDFSIIAQYQAEYRGIVQYYLLAFNVHRLWRLHRTMELSLAKTLADKYRSSVNKVFRKYQTTVPTPHGRHKVLEVQIKRDGKEPLIARFGGIELRWQKQITLNDQPKEVYSARSELIQRLLAQECELCGSENNCQVHHVRKLADLNRPGQKAKPLWVKRMVARRRKTLIVCQECHGQIHQEFFSRHKIKA